VIGVEEGRIAGLSDPLEVLSLSNTWTPSVVKIEDERPPGQLEETASRVVVAVDRRDVEPAESLSEMSVAPSGNAFNPVRGLRRSISGAPRRCELGGSVVAAASRRPR
jgi:hypothetical protein